MNEIIRKQCKLFRTILRYLPKDEVTQAAEATLLALEALAEERSQVRRKLYRNDTGAVAFQARDGDEDDDRKDRRRKVNNNGS